MKRPDIPIGSYFRGTFHVYRRLSTVKTVIVSKRANDPGHTRWYPGVVEDTLGIIDVSVYRPIPCAEGRQLEIEAKLDGYVFHDD